MMHLGHFNSTGMKTADRVSGPVNTSKRPWDDGDLVGFRCLGDVFPPPRWAIRFVVWRLQSGDLPLPTALTQCGALPARIRRARAYA